MIEATTLPYEGRSAIELAGETLWPIREASKDTEHWGGPVPEKLRQIAIRILRHYPEPWQIEAATKMDGLQSVAGSAANQAQRMAHPRQARTRELRRSHHEFTHLNPDVQIG